MWYFFTRKRSSNESQPATCTSFQVAVTIPHTLLVIHCLDVLCLFSFSWLELNLLAFLFSFSPYKPKRAIASTEDEIAQVSATMRCAWPPWAIRCPFTYNMFGLDWNLLGADDFPSQPVLNMRSDPQVSEEEHLKCRTICLRPTTRFDPTGLGLDSAIIRLAKNLLTNCLPHSRLWRLHQTHCHRQLAYQYNWTHSLRLGMF